MLTTIGKSATFLLVAFSVFALGVAMWVAADPVQIPGKGGSLTPAYKAKQDKLEEEIAKLRTQVREELNSLVVLVSEQSRKQRKMPLDPEDPFGTAKASKTVAEAEKDLAKLEADLKTLFNDWNSKQTALSTLINDLDITRTQVRAALAEQKRLAEIITPDVQKTPGAQSFREQTAAAMAAKQESEKRQEDLKPILVNETLRLMGLTKRSELLDQRASELGVGP